MPYMMQRLVKRSNPDNYNGVDRVVGYDYMGSAEFEFGALSESLRELRTHNNKLHSVKFEDRKWWFFGPIERLGTAQTWTEGQLKGSSSNHLEPSYLLETYRGEGNIIGWWCLDKGGAFLIFTKRKDAVKFEKALKVVA
jgi:hypothetical protein